MVIVSSTKWLQELISMDFPQQQQNYINPLMNVPEISQARVCGFMHVYIKINLYYLNTSQSHIG